MNKVVLFLSDIYCHRALLYELTKRDFQARYLGSFLGTFWAFAQPLATILVMFAAFEFGFRPGRIHGEVPFFLWLALGLIPWFFLSEAILTCANAVLEQGQIIKKVVFRVSLLPLVKILSSLIVHLFFIGFLLVLALCYGFKPSLHVLQVFYYLGATIFLLLGLGWLTSSIVVFFRDFGQIIGVLVQMGFWITPIFWQHSLLPERLQILVKINPAYYIIKGYRESFVTKVWFWESWEFTIYFWALSSLLFVLGIVVFKRLKPHFADVL